MDWVSEQIWIQTTPTSYYDLLPRPLPEIILCHAHFLVITNDIYSRLNLVISVVDDKYIIGLAIHTPLLAVHTPL